jgi:hypothetical protein
MNRKVPGWIALITSLCGCAPLACLFGVLSLAGTYSAFDPSYSWENLDTALLSIFSVSTIIALGLGILFLAVGIWLLLSARKASRSV